MATEAYVVLGNAAHIAVLIGQPPVQGPVTPSQDSHVLNKSTTPLDDPLSGCTLLSSQAATQSALLWSDFAGEAIKREANGSEAHGVEADVDAAAVGAEGAGPAAEGVEQRNPRPSLQQTRTQGSGALGNSAARRVVAGVVDEATGGMNAGEVLELRETASAQGASLLKSVACTADIRP